ncbi:uncharacterized protein LOC132543068, partial [Ylistrum balloti]|uniref:uncharacterized protein LOC132543068 n=1 Tax=Ylistrum balloti TaxID=509963 RepID=UPI002905EFC5
TAFWQVNLEQDVVIDHVVVIFQKGNTSQRKQQKRRNGYSIIVTDSPTYLPMTSANTCYNDKDPDLSAENHENRSCSIIGKYVTIYNQRKTLSGPNYSKNAVLELCEVHVMGCPLTKYGTECKEDCPENCKNRLCFPRNGTCMKGCSPGYLPPKCGQGFQTKKKRFLNWLFENSIGEV